MWRVGVLCERRACRRNDAFVDNALLGELFEFLLQTTGVDYEPFRRRVCGARNATYDAIRQRRLVGRVRTSSSACTLYQRYHRLVASCALLDTSDVVWIQLVCHSNRRRCRRRR